MSQVDHFVSDTFIFIYLIIYINFKNIHHFRFLTVDGGSLNDMYPIIQKQKSQIELLKKPQKKTNANNSERSPFVHPSIIYEFNRYTRANNMNINPDVLNDIIKKFKSNEIISIDINKLSYENN